MKKLSYILAMLIALCLCSFAAQAQETTTKTKTKAKTHETSVTGCLAKGDAADEYKITDSSGKTHELRSTSVDLASHVGHTVTVTGSMAHETAKEESKEEKTGTATKEKSASKQRYLRVSDLKMVSETCK